MLVLGIGAMGGVVAARLLAAGHAPTLVAGPRMAAHIGPRGISLRDGGRDRHMPAPVFASPGDIPPGDPFDIVLVLTKAHAAEEAARAALPRTAGSTVFVPMQNGIAWPRVAAVAGAGRVIACVLNWGATMHAPGVYEQTAANGTFLGELDGRTTDRLRRLGRMLECVTPITLSPAIVGAQWAKLQMNCSVTTLGALADQPLAVTLASEPGRSVFLAVCREVLAVADAEKIRLETLAVDPYTPRTGPPGAIDAWLRRVVEVYGATRPSILQDLQRARRTEIDFITGYVAQRAEVLSVPASLCRAMTAMIHEAESGRRTLSPANLVELQALAAGPSPQRS